MVLNPPPVRPRVVRCESGKEVKGCRSLLDSVKGCVPRAGAVATTCSSSSDTSSASSTSSITGSARFRLFFIANAEECSVADGAGRKV